MLPEFNVEEFIELTLNVATEFVRYVVKYIFLEHKFI